MVHLTGVRLILKGVFLIFAMSVFLYPYLYPTLRKYLKNQSKDEILKTTEKKSMKKYFLLY